MTAEERLHLDQYAGEDFERTVNSKNAEDSELTRFTLKSFDPSAPTLEIGCLAGAISFGLERHLGFTNLTAIDMVEELIAEARKQPSKIAFEVGNVCNLRFSDESFDQILCAGVVISHIIEKERRLAALGEMFRVLKPGGRMIIDARTFDQRGVMTIVKWLVALTRLAYNPHHRDRQTLPRLGQGGKADPWFLKTNKAQLYFYRPGEFIFDLTNAGFSVESFYTGMGEYHDSAHAIVALLRK